VTLLAFAAERRAAAPLLLGARRCRSISPARRAHSSKPAARRGCGTRRNRQTDRRTDRRTPYRYIDPAAYYASSVNRQIILYGATPLLHITYCSPVSIGVCFVVGTLLSFTRSTPTSSAVDVESLPCSRSSGLCHCSAVYPPDQTPPPIPCSPWRVTYAKHSSATPLAGKQFENGLPDI